MGYRLSFMQTPLLEQTGQRAKLLAAAILLCGGFTVASIAPLLISRGWDVAGIALLAGGALAMLVAVVLAQRATTCPQCKIRWLQYAIGKQAVSGWLRWLLTLKRCPGCGYPAHRKRGG